MTEALAPNRSVHDRNPDYPGFPSALSDEELAGAFLIDDFDARLIANRRRNSNRLGFAIQLGTVRLLGRFLQDPAEVPGEVVQFVAGQLGQAGNTDADLAIYAKGEARWDHQDEIKVSYEYRRLQDPHVELGIVEWLEARAWVNAESRQALFTRATEYLISTKVLLPGASVLWRLVSSVRERASERGWKLLSDGLSAETSSRLRELLVVSDDDQLSGLERLRRGPVSPTVTGLVIALERVAELEELTQDLPDLGQIPVSRIRALTTDARTKRAQDIEKMGFARKMATLVAFSATTFLSARDDALDHLDVTLGEMRVRVASQTKRDRLRNSKAIDRASIQLSKACSVVLDESVEPREMREAIFGSVNREALAAAVEAINELVKTPDQRARELIISRYRQVRKFLPLLENLRFTATEAGEPILESLLAMEQTRHRKSLSSTDLPMAAIPKQWKTLVDPANDGHIDKKAYAFAVLESLGEGLHRRDVNLSESSRWGDPRNTLLSSDIWETTRSDTCRSLQLPSDPQEFLDGLGTDLDGAYGQAMSVAEGPSAPFTFGEDDLSLRKLDALEEPPSLINLRQEIDAVLPDADLPDLVLEIATKTRFMDEFIHARDSKSSITDLPLSLCAVLVSQACNVGYGPVVDPTNPALTEERLKWVARHYLRPETIIAANARIVDYHANLPLAKLWGGGEVASIDGLRFVVPRDTVNARYNRRYFHRSRGVTALGTTSDHFAGIHTTVVPGTQPDALFLLDGLLDPQTTVRPNEIMTDTAGYTDQIFGLFRLLGYQFSPRLADSGGSRFWRIDKEANYGPLNSVARHQINTNVIVENYDDLLRIAGTLVQQAATGSDLLRALRSRTRHLGGLAQALASVGRVAKTIHLLNFCSDQQFRRRILTQLNRGESRHALAREVCHGRSGELRQAYRTGQETQLGALGLIVNCVVLYNTIYTGRALEQRKLKGQLENTADIQRLAPLATEHITLTGRYHLQLPDKLHDQAAYRSLKQNP